MKNPLKFRGNELKYLEQVINSENWSCTTGSWAQNLEIAFASKVGTKFGIAMNSGTSTLHAALEALGVRPGDEIITPALTVIMDTTCILHANAIPIYADVDPESFLIDPKDVAKKITPKTKAIIAVSLYGMPPDYDELKKIAGNIPIIEDNAQCFFSMYKEQMTGTIGTFSSYSFENSKHLVCGEGGILLTSNEQLAEKARKAAGHGFKNLRAEEGRVRLDPTIFQDPHYKRHDSLGWNYRMPEFSAAIVMAQLEKAQDLIGLRVESANMFIEAIGNCEAFLIQRANYPHTNSYYTLGVKYYGDMMYGVSWQEFRKTYMEKGGDGIFGAWSVPYLEPLISEGIYKKRYPEIYNKLEYPKGLCPEAEKIQPLILQMKTNYRDLRLARKKADILKETIEELFY